jgi:membrane associated rhomboid family serine protease
MYVRLFTHVLPHQGLPHFTGNFLLILAVGPLVEEKYGSRPLAKMMLITAGVTGLVNVVFFPGIMLLGASGLAFMLILLASFANMRAGRLPLTFLLVALLYVGNEIVAGLFANDNISQLSHIIGGFCGSAFGFAHGNTRQP